MTALAGGQNEDVCVAHLVWKPLGIEPFRDFIKSYKKFPGGVDHRFLVVYNGFEPGEDLDDYRRELGGIDHRELILPEPIQDIPAYFAAAAEAKEHYICFLNSHSIIRDELWLQKLLTCLRLPGVGLVGATACRASLLSFAMLKDHGTGFYRGLFDRYAPGETLPRHKYLREVLRMTKRRFFAPSVRIHERHFLPFPCDQLRTNTFMLRRETMLELQRGAIRTKFDAYVFESGFHSLTAQILGRQQNVLVVGRDGVGYPPADWHKSDTFWQGEQKNLLVADNQTRRYENGTRAQRQFLRRFGWGLTAEEADC